MKLRKDIDIVLFLKEARKCSEDVFLETVGKGIPKKNGNFNCYLGKMD